MEPLVKVFSKVSQVNINIIIIVAVDAGDFLQSLQSLLMVQQKVARALYLWCNTYIARTVVLVKSN